MKTWKYAAGLGVTVVVILAGFLIWNLTQKAEPAITQYHPTNQVPDSTSSNNILNLVIIIFVIVIGLAILAASWLALREIDRKSYRQHFLITPDRRGMLPVARVALENGAYDLVTAKSIMAFHTAQAIKAGRQEVPYHYAPHITYAKGLAQENTPVSEFTPLIEQPLKVAPITAFEAMDSLQRNQLGLCFGVDQEGVVITSTLPDSVHILNVGSTGMGKSTLAANLLAQLITLNSRELLEVALLDIKGTTAKWFGGHIKEIATKGPKIVETISKVRRLVDYRREHSIVGDRTFLLVIEEALALKYYLTVEEFASYSNDFNSIALLGREFGVFIMACSQVDYSSKELKNSRGQFASRMSAAVMPSAASAMGFTNTQLVKEVWKNRKPGQFLLESPDQELIISSPRLDLKGGELAKLLPARTVSTSFTSFNNVKVEPKPVETFAYEVSPQVSEFQVKETVSTELSQAQRIEIAKKLKETLDMPKTEIIWAVWGAKTGGTAAYKEASELYDTHIKEKGKQ